MMMNLDEEIKHCEEIVNDMENREGYAFIAITYAECASEHRQLAKWLKELEAYIKIISELSEALHFYDGCEKCQGFREYPTSDFVDDVRSWVKQFEEVNTDES